MTDNVVPIKEPEKRGPGRPKGSKNKANILQSPDQKFVDQISIFEKHQKKLSKMVGYKAGDDVESHQIALQAVRSSVAMFVEVIPKAEKVFNKYHNERAAYALVSVTNVFRELLKDLVALSSTSKIGDRIVETAIDPALINMAQGHISGLKSLRQAIYSKVDKKRARKKLLAKVDRLIKQESGHINEIRNQTVEQIDKVVNSKDIR